MSTMTMEQVRNRLRKAEAEGGTTMWAGECGNLVDVIDAHLAQVSEAMHQLQLEAVGARAEADRYRILSEASQPAECQHDWAEGYGVPAYCNHCGIRRDPQPTQTVDMKAIQEVIAMYPKSPLADKLTRAISGEQAGPLGGDRTIYDHRIAVDNACRDAAPMLYLALKNLLEAVKERRDRMGIESVVISDAENVILAASPAPDKEG